MSIDAGAEQDAKKLLANAISLNGNTISMEWLLESAYTRGVSKHDLMEEVKRSGLKWDSVDGRKYLYHDQQDWDKAKAWMLSVSAWNKSKDAEQ